MVNQSIVAWCLSSIVGVFYGLNIFFNDLYHSSIVEIFSGVLLCLSTVLPIVGFHFLKIRKLREGVTERRDTIKAMNRMVFAICIVQMLSTTSSAMLTILFFETKINTAILVWTLTVVVLLNHAANPMLFFFFNLYKKHFNQRQTNCTNVAENTYTDSRLWNIEFVNLIVCLSVCVVCFVLGFFFSDKETSFLDLNIKVIDSYIPTSVYEKRDDFQVWISYS